MKLQLEKSDDVAMRAAGLNKQIPLALKGIVQVDKQSAVPWMLLVQSEKARQHEHKKDLQVHAFAVSNLQQRGSSDTQLCSGSKTKAKWQL